MRACVPCVMHGGVACTLSHIALSRATGRLSSADVSLSDGTHGVQGAVVHAHGTACRTRREACTARVHAPDGR